MWTDYAPVGNTCPDIDVAVGLLDALREVDGIEEADLNQAIDALERVRAANETLRKWGNGLASDLDDSNKDLAAKTDECNDLERELAIAQEDRDQYQARVEELEGEVRRLEREVEGLESERDGLPL